MKSDDEFNDLLSRSIAEHAILAGVILLVIFIMGGCLVVTLGAIK